MRLIAYLRVSTVGQVKDGLGLPTQERMVRSWANKGGHRLVATASDNGKSGTLAETDRPGLLEALTAVRTGAADGIVFTSLDRLARTLTVQEALLAKIWSYGTERRPVKVFTVDGGEVHADDPDDPMRSAMRQMAGVFAELDRKLVIKRLRNGRATKAAAGGHAVGRAPYGWTARAGDLVEDEGEQAIVNEMRSWSVEGASLAEIARRLNDRGIAPKSKAGVWHPTTVSRTLSRG